MKNVKDLNQLKMEALEETQKKSLPFKYQMTRVHKKEIAPRGEIFLIVQTTSAQYKNTWDSYRSYLKVPINCTDEQFLEIATEMYRGLVKKYKLAEL